MIAPWKASLQKLRGSAPPRESSLMAPFQRLRAMAKRAPHEIIILHVTPDVVKSTGRVRVRKERPQFMRRLKGPTELR